MTDVDLTAVQVMFVALFVYLVPTVVAAACRHRQQNAIFALNLCLGWTGLGWVVALIWALIRKDR